MAISHLPPIRYNFTTPSWSFRLERPARFKIYLARGCRYTQPHFSLLPKARTYTAAVKLACGLLKRPGLLPYLSKIQQPSSLVQIVCGVARRRTARQHKAGKQMNTAQFHFARTGHAALYLSHSSASCGQPRLARYSKTHLPNIKPEDYAGCTLLRATLPRAVMQ